MFIGHLGAGLALKHVGKKINLAIILVAVLLSDILLWIFILAGWEQVLIPENYSQIHYLNFIFPYTHSLLGTLILATIFYWIFRIRKSDKKICFLLFTAVISHFILDYLVHPAEIPITFFKKSTNIGLGLWDHLYAELIIEWTLLIIGLYYYLKGIYKNKKITILFYCSVSVIATVGQLFMPAPTNSFQIAGNSLLILIIIIASSFYIDRKNDIYLNFCERNK